MNYCDVALSEFYQQNILLRKSEFEFNYQKSSINDENDEHYVKLRKKERYSTLLTGRLKNGQNNNNNKTESVFYL